MENRCLMQSTFICGPSRSYMGKYLSYEKAQRPQLTSELSLVRGFFGLQKCWLGRGWMDKGFHCLGTKLAMLGFTIIQKLCGHVSVRLHLRWQSMMKSSACREKKKSEPADKKCRQWWDSWFLSSDTIWRGKMPGAQPWILQVAKALLNFIWTLDN